MAAVTDQQQTCLFFEHRPLISLNLAVSQEKVFPAQVQTNRCTLTITYRLQSSTSSVCQQLENLRKGKTSVRYLIHLVCVTIFSLCFSGPIWPFRSDPEVNSEFVLRTYLEQLVKRHFIECSQALIDFLFATSSFLCLCCVFWSQVNESEYDFVCVATS